MMTLIEYEQFLKDFDIHYKETDFGIDNTFSKCLLKQTSKNCINEFYNKRHDLINRINENTDDTEKIYQYRIAALLIYHINEYPSTLLKIAEESDLDYSSIMKLGDAYRDMGISFDSLY